MLYDCDRFVTTKPGLRRLLLARRQALPEDEKRYAEIQVMNHLIHLLRYLKPGPSVAGYLAVQGELDVLAALKSFKNNGFSVCLPVLPESKELPLCFCGWDPDRQDELEPGPFGIHVPRQKNNVIPDALLVPLVGFTRFGQRLGYGGGWYDRTVSHLRQLKPGLPVIGIAFACQEVDSLPTDPWDQLLDCIVTQQGVIRV